VIRLGGIVVSFNLRLVIVANVPSDAIHAVESEHRGEGPSAVLYIPAVPLSPINAAYLKDQSESFLAGIPPPDFPGGVGERQFIGRGTMEDMSESAKQG
jgi:hypothetical protein